MRLLKIFSERLQNGTNCYIIEKRGCGVKEALFAVDFGSASRVVPAGTAHFLEHKVFDQKDVNVFEEFSKHGADVNAFTNFSTTAYYFSCYRDFWENLKILLEFTANAYLTDESISREKGIIAEEIGMYEDDPWWQVYFNLLGCLYSENPVRNNIAGSLRDIEAADKELLQSAYDRFYCGENSALILCGDFEAEKAFEAAEKLSCMKKGAKPQKPAAKEDKIGGRIKRVGMEVSKPLFNVGFRERDFDTPAVKRLCGARLLLDMILGKGSELYDRLYMRGDIASDFSMEYLLGDDFGAAVFSGVSDRGETVCEEILREAGRLKKEGFDKRLLDISRKRLAAAFMMGTDNIHSVCSAVCDYAFKNIDFWDIYNGYFDIGAEELYRRLEMFDSENCAISIVEPAL